MNKKTNKKTTKKQIKNTKGKTSQNSKIIYIIIALIVVLGTTLLCICTIDKEWEINGNIVSRGKETYEIGDYYEYDETNGGEIKDLTDVKWKVLGVKNGHLLIVSDDKVEDLTLGSTEDIEKAKNDFITGKDKMNAISEKYAKGENALSARSISKQDIIDVFNINEEEKTIKEEVSYYWGSDSKVISIDQSGQKSSTNLYKDGKFHWYDFSQNKWNVVENNKEGTDKEPKSIVSVKSNLTTLEPTTFDKNFHNNFDEEHNYIGKDKKIEMLFSKSLAHRVNYWTTDQITFSLSSSVGYGYNSVKGFELNYNYLVFSAGVPREITLGIRPVVTIK